MTCVIGKAYTKQEQAKKKNNNNNKKKNLYITSIYKIMCVFKSM